MGLWGCSLPGSAAVQCDWLALERADLKNFILAVSNPFTSLCQTLAALSHLGSL